MGVVQRARRRLDHDHPEVRRQHPARAIHLATSLVALLQLAAAAGMWVWATNVSPTDWTGHNTASVVSLSGGALLANLVSVTLLVVETASFRRR